MGKPTALGVGQPQSGAPTPTLVGLPTPRALDGRAGQPFGATIRPGRAVRQDVSIDDGVVTTGVTRVQPNDGTGSFDAFVAARSQALLRTAYLLTRDHALAEDPVQTALAKAWFHWSRIDKPGAVRTPDRGHDVLLLVAPSLERRDPDAGHPIGGKLAIALYEPVP
jgi:hypothetical protein